MAVISMQQTEHCISTILMWWSRPGHRQTALSSSSLLCTHQGLCRDQEPTTVVREQQMGRTRVCQVYMVHLLATTGASGLIKQKMIVFFYCENYNVWVSSSWKHVHVPCLQMFHSYPRVAWAVHVTWPLPKELCASVWCCTHECNICQECQQAQRREQLYIMESPLGINFPYVALLA